ncbi:MAG: ketopantoate reductase family protein [Thermoplasmata archaeon]
MKINIIGPGSMGIVLSYFLHKKNDVSLIVRKGQLHNHENGLKIIENGKEENFSLHVEEDISDSDLTIIAVKSYDLESVFGQYDLKGRVILIQNGLAHLKMEKAGVEKFYAVTTWGAKKIAKGVAELTGRGYFRIGSDSGRMDISFLTEAGINAVWSENIREELYRKAAINAVINPITSIFGVKNGEVVRSKELWEIASGAIKELEQLFSTMGYNLEVEKNVVETCRVTSENVSSMLQDIQQGRRSEIDAITGEIIALGRKEGMEMKVNSFLYESVKFIQNNRMNAI